jgi:hypothetical protein
VKSEDQENNTLLSGNSKSEAEQARRGDTVGCRVGQSRKDESSIVQRLATVFLLDVRSLAAYRIFFGLVILSDLLIRAQDLRFFYSDEGVLPRSVYPTLSGPWDISLYLANGSWQFAAFLLSITIGVCIAFICGYRTKNSSILLFFLVLSLQFRNHLVLQGGDGVVRCFLFWSMFLPLGQCWSIDARINSSRFGQTPSLQLCSVASMCAVFQIAMIYFFAAVMKSHEIWRVHGTALQYALNVDSLTNANGHYLLQFPNFMRVATFAVLGIEQYAIALLFLPWRYQLWRLILVATFFSFHLGIAVTMELGIFPYVCLAIWVLLLPPVFWEFLQQRVSQYWYRPRAKMAPLQELHVQQTSATNGLFATLQSAILAFFILCVLQWNIRNLQAETAETVYPAKYDFILTLVGLAQNWGMFSPYPLNWDGWFLIRGRTASGRIVNLSPGAEEDDTISEERPKEIWRMYGNERQRKYMMSLASYSSMLWRPYYVRAVALQWARKYPMDPLAELDILFFQEITLPDGRSTTPEKFPIWHSKSPSSGY